jgi:hypothetical protein
MRDFGYSGVTADDIRKAHDDWKAGREAQGVIAMFSVKEFNERPEIFGTPDDEPDLGDVPRNGMA